MDGLVAGGMVTMAVGLAVIVAVRGLQQFLPVLSGRTWDLSNGDQR